MPFAALLVLTWYYSVYFLFSATSQVEEFHSKMRYLICRAGHFFERKKKKKVYLSRLNTNAGVSRDTNQVDLSEWRPGARCGHAQRKMHESKTNQTTLFKSVHVLNLQMCKNSEFSWSAAILTRRFKVISFLSPICQYLLEQNDHWGPAVQVLIIKLRKQWLTSVPVSQSVVTVKPRDSETGVAKWKSAIMLFSSSLLFFEKEAIF